MSTRVEKPPSASAVGATPEAWSDTPSWNAAAQPRGSTSKAEANGPPGERHAIRLCRRSPPRRSRGSFVEVNGLSGQLHPPTGGGLLMFGTSP